VLMDLAGHNWPEGLKQAIDYVTFRELDPQTVMIHFDEKLSAGGFGDVFAGRFEEKMVAVKRISPSQFDPVLFFRELCLLSMMNHPHLVKFCGNFYKEGLFYLVMEKYEKSLKSQISLPIMNDHQKHKIAVGISNGLMCLHSLDIVHRDLKADNVLIDKDMNAVISDFGIAKLQ